MNRKKNQLINLLLITLVLIYSVSCESSKKHLSQGNYDAAANTSIRKLQKDRKNEKEMYVLDEAYKKAVQTDLERIKFLNQNGEPDRWAEIFNIYSKMKSRQDYLKTVLPLVKKDGTKMNFEIIDYDLQIVEAKKKAAEFNYVNGKNLMKKKTKADYRAAYYEFQKAQSYTMAYTDIPKLMDECRANGTVYALIIAKNNTIIKLPEDLLKNIITLDVALLNSEWMMYDYLSNKNTKYDVHVIVSLKIADVSPNGISEKRRKESAEVKDGWEYILDDKGNVKRDSLGNDMKKPKIITVYCDIIETMQYKNGHIEGFVEYVDAYSKQTLRSIPIGADHHFEHFYAMANGDLRALSNNTKDMLENRPAAYPDDWAMMYGAAETLKSSIMNVLIDNKRFLVP